LKQIFTGIFAILNSREKIKFGKLIIFNLVIGILDIAFLGLLLVVINFYTKNTVSPKVSFIPGYLLNQNSLALIGVFFALFSIKNWFGYLGLRSEHHFFYSVASRLSKRNIENYLADDYIHYVNINSSVQIRRISQLPIEFSHYILTNFQQVISQVILIFFTACAILFYHPTLFLLLFLLLSPPVIALAWFIRKKLKDIRADTKIVSEKTIQHLQEALSGYVESNIYDKDSFFADRYYHQQQRLNENISTMQTLQSLPSRLIEIFAVLGFFILVMINKWWSNAPGIDLLTIGIFMGASYKIIPGIVKILNCTGQMKTYQFTLTDLSPSKNQAATERRNQSGHIESIKFEKVYFKYKDRIILNGVDFEMKPGDFAGISGISGKGKTTFTNLLLGFLEPDCGSIYLNNKTTERQLFRNKISYVKQQPFFINDSIVNNITLTDDNYDLNKLNEVLAFCGIDSFLAEYPEGLQKTIKENGKNISGGQRQRIMLARALYHDFDLLILDEPFSEMHTEAENCILSKLKSLTRQGKMILFITHNKRSLSFCNKIFSLDAE